MGVIVTFKNIIYNSPFCISKQKILYLRGYIRYFYDYSKIMNLFIMGCIFIYLIFILLDKSNSSSILVTTFWSGKGKYAYLKFVMFSIAIIWGTMPPLLKLMNLCFKIRERTYSKSKYILSKNFRIFLVVNITSTILFICISRKAIPLLTAYIADEFPLIEFSFFTELIGIVGFVGSIASIASILGLSRIFPPDNIESNYVDLSAICPKKSVVLNLNVGSLSPRINFVSQKVSDWNDFIDIYSPTSNKVLYAITSTNKLTKTESNKLFPWQGINHLREQILDILKSDTTWDNLFFVTSTTRALELAIDIFNPEKIVLTDQEHITKKYFIDINRRKYQTNITEVSVNDNRNNIVDLERFIDKFVTKCYEECYQEKSALVLLSHVCYANGLILPVKEICRQLRERIPTVKIIIDGAHSLGNINFSLSEIDCDIYVSSGHKWLFGFPSLGIMVTRNTVCKEKINLLKNNIHEAFAFNNQNNFETSTINTDPFIALSTSLYIIQTIELQQIQDTMKFLNSYFHRMIAKSNNFFSFANENNPIIPSDNQAYGIVNLYSKKNLDIDMLNIVKEKLEKQKVIVKVVESNGFPPSLRLCLPFYLRKSEIRRGVKIIDDVWSSIYDKL